MVIEPPCSLVCGNSKSSFSPKKPFFIRGSNGAMLRRTSTIQMGENVMIQFEVPLAMA
jgi:hypothetical protein